MAKPRVTTQNTIGYSQQPSPLPHGYKEGTNAEADKTRLELQQLVYLTLNNNTWCTQWQWTDQFHTIHHTVMCDDILITMYCLTYKSLVINGNWMPYSTICMYMYSILSTRKVAGHLLTKDNSFPRKTPCTIIH